MKIILPAVVVLVALVGGFATYQFVLSPMLAPPDDEEAKTAQEDPGEAIPMNPVTVEFTDIIANSLREGDEPRSMILASVTLECFNETTAALIEKHRPRFRDMVLKVHQSVTQAELADVLLLQESIQRRIRQRANDILKRAQLPNDPDPEIRVTDVFHGDFAVQEGI